MGNQRSKGASTRENESEGERVEEQSADPNAKQILSESERELFPPSVRKGREESPFFAQCPRVIDPIGFLGVLNSSVRHVNEAQAFVSEFRGNSQIIAEALDLFAKQVLSPLSFPLHSFTLFPSLPFFLMYANVVTKAPLLFVEACSQSSVICDFRLPDVPIVWCNDFFERYLPHHSRMQLRFDQN